MDGKGNPSESPLFSNSFDALLKRRMAEHSYESHMDKVKSLAESAAEARRAYFRANWHKRVARHSEEIRQYKREYYLANREKIKARSVQWRMDHPERAKELQRRSIEVRRAKRLAMKEAEK